MTDGLGMVSGSDDEDDAVASGDDGEVPAPLPLSLLGGGTKPAPPKPPTKPVVSTEKAPAAPKDNDDAAKDARSAQAGMTGPAEEQQAERAAEESDDSDDDAKLTTPNQLPPHKPLAAPSVDLDSTEPFDAAKAAEMARKGVTTADAPVQYVGSGASLANAASEKTPGVVDDALRGLVLMLKGEKNDSLCQVPMCQCVHGLVKDEEGNTWPPYEITLIEARASQFNRQQWLNEHMQTDPNRLLNTILFFNVDPEASLDLNDLLNASSHKLQAMLPGVLVNPDDNADAAKRIIEYNDAIGSTEWTFAIPVPAQFVKNLYRQHKHGLPTLYNPITHDNVKFQLFDKVENQSQRDNRWKLVVDKSREGQASAAAANGGSRAKRGTAEENGAARKRPVNKPAQPAIAATLPTTAPDPPPPAAANIQTTLRFAPSAPPATTQNGGTNHGSAASTDSTASAASEPPAFPVTVYEQQQQQPCVRPAFAHTALHWTAISPEWFSVVVPKLPKGFVVEMSAPTVHCSGMVSFKRATDEEDV